MVTNTYIHTYFLFFLHSEEANDKKSELNESKHVNVYMCWYWYTICKPDEYKININNEIGEKILFRDSNNIRSKKNIFFFRLKRMVE